MMLMSSYAFSYQIARSNRKVPTQKKTSTMPKSSQKALASPSLPRVPTSGITRWPCLSRARTRSGCTRRETIPCFRRQSFTTPTELRPAAFTSRSSTTTETQQPLPLNRSLQPLPLNRSLRRRRSPPPPHRRL